jgi:hypothetical protein
MGRRTTKALDNVKQYMKSPPVLMPPQDKKVVQIIFIGS